MSDVNNRFLSLDVFRGLILCFVIIVNMPGNPETTVPALTFARWNGFTPADIIYPAFLFCVGIGMFFSFQKWRTEGAVYKIYLSIFKRGILLFVIGVLLNWFPFVQSNMDTGKWEFIPFSQVRIWGILQRIGFCYLLVGLMIQVLKLRATLAITLVCLVMYWPVLYYFGGEHPYSIRQNLVLHIDKWMIGTDHLDQSPLVPFEEFGFLSTFPALGNVVAGYLAARFILRNKITYETLTHLLLTGFLLMVLAYIWNNVFPVNRKLWTSSFAVMAIGLSLNTLAFIVFMVDKMKHIKEANFFRVFGRNPLVAFLLSMTMTVPLQLIEVQPGLSITDWLYINIFSHATAYIGSFLQAAFFMLIIWGLCYALDKKGEYIIL
ncbi:MULTISPECIES: acyltransferase family protein [Chitinophagaceae]